MKSALSIAIIFLALGFHASALQEQQQVRDVTLEDLSAHPADYDGQHVRVKGFFVMRFENRALYPSADDMTRRKALWVANTIDIANRIRELAGQYVVMEGTIDSRSHGHLGKFAGTIVVNKVEPDEKRNAMTRRPDDPVTRFSMRAICAHPRKSEASSLVVAPLRCAFVSPCLRGGCSA